MSIEEIMEQISQGLYEGDRMVWATQTWLNETYGHLDCFNTIATDGITGTGTVTALAKALQIELNVSPVDGIIGTGTLNAFTPMSKQDDNDNSTSNLNVIIQGALWCKGYNAAFNGMFDEPTETGIKQMQSDAGLSVQDGIVNGMILKSLLTMTYFVLPYGGNYSDSERAQMNKIRTAQRWLNNKYASSIGQLQACDGIVSRGNCKALIYGLQVTQGQSNPDGIWGNNTQSLCPTLSINNYQNYSSNYTYLLQIALYFMGHDPNGLDGQFGNGVKNAVIEFQSFMTLDADGIVGKKTWAALVVSYGDKSRAAKACDCATILTDSLAQTLVNNQYEIVGRYLTGYVGNGISKALTTSEINVILNAGLRFFPIYQTSARTEAYFNRFQGILDALQAINAAYKLHIPENTIIYFAVDFDAMDYQITNNIIPYFSAANDVFTANTTRTYKIGIYGSRNVCSVVCKRGYAISSFVGNMSSGYSGNLGYSMPDNWAFDQFSNETIGTGNDSIEIDKDGYSGRNSGVSGIQYGNIGTSFEYKYGSVINPNNNEIYPISYPENYTTVIEPMYDIVETITLQNNQFDIVQFISGLEIDDSLIDSDHPLIGGFAGFIVGGITAFADSWNSLYIDICFYKVSSTGQKKAVLKCGTLQYLSLFNDWEYYGIPISLKSLHNFWSGDNWPSWESSVDSMAKEQYGIYKGIEPNNDYSYDIEYTFDSRRESDPYISYIFLGKDGNMYEYLKLYEGEKIEIVVKNGLNQVDRLNLVTLISPITKLSDDKAALFNNFNNY